LNTLIAARARVLAAAVALAALAAACGGSSAKNQAQSANAPSATVSASRGKGTPAVATAALQPVIASSELVVGPNRFTLGVLDHGGTPIPDAKVHLKFFQLSAAPSGSGAVQGTLRFEADTTFRSPGREAGLPNIETVVRPDGTKIFVQSGGDEVGVYQTQVTFDKAGDWGVQAEVVGKDTAHSGTVSTPFKVLAQGIAPMVGSPAPRSKNLTVNDVTDLSIIDTSARPTADMHTKTIAEAIAAGQPTLVLFATPGYCSSRLCGPELELARKLEPKYQGKVEFIHIEIYKDPGTRTVMPTVAEWHLESEPWFFVIDSKGVISARFEGPTTLEELDAALQQVTSGQASVD